MRRRDFIAGSGALLLTGLPELSLAQIADKGGLLAAQARLNATLVGHLQGARGRSDNIVVSPASLTAILAVLAQGADPRMQAAIHKCLGLDGASDTASGDLQVLRSQLRNVGLAREEQGATFTLANLIVIDPASQPNAPVVARLRDGAEVVIDDLSKLATVNQINAWVSGQTKGFIRKVFDGPQRATGLAGVNALYFKGLWKDRFDAKLTQARPFHLVGGGASDVPLMMRIGSYRHRQDGRFVAVDLPYRNERFGLVVATTSDTPATAAEFSHVGDWLTGEDFSSGRVDLSLPRFTMAEGADILEALDAAGLNAARLSPTSFAPLFSVPQTLSRIAQRTYLRVDEEGTEAAATTAITMSRTSMQSRTVKIVVDKPFVFALRDRQSGLILLSGYVGRIPGKPVES
ncbi:MAG: serpin family protein [Xanthobacteraceae bacterium]